MTGFAKRHLQQILKTNRAEVTEDFLKDFWVGPVNLAAAKIRRAEDKDMIDGFIQQLPGGFEKMNRTITDKLLE